MLNVLSFANVDHYFEDTFGAPFRLVVGFVGDEMAAGAEIRSGAVGLCDGDDPHVVGEDWFLPGGLYALMPAFDGVDLGVGTKVNRRRFASHHIDDESAAAGQLGNRMFGRIADIDGPEWQLEDILLGPVRLDHDVPLPVDVRLRPPQFDCRVVRLVRMELHVHACRAGQLRLGISDARSTLVANPLARRAANLGKLPLQPVARRTLEDTLTSRSICDLQPASVRSIGNLIDRSTALQIAVPRWEQRWACHICQLQRIVEH